MMAETLIILGILAYIGFRHWLRHDRRRMIHRERLAAIEKGLELPAIEHERSRFDWSVQRFLLVAGLSWIAIGVGGGLSLFLMLRHAPAEWIRDLPPPGTEVAALIPVGIGVAHLITFWIGERRERREGWKQT
jgi:hypothetical protein